MTLGSLRPSPGTTLITSQHFTQAGPRVGTGRPQRQAQSYNKEAEVNGLLTLEYSLLPQVHRLSQGTITSLWSPIGSHFFHCRWIFNQSGEVKHSDENVHERNLQRSLRRGQTGDTFVPSPRGSKLKSPEPLGAPRLSSQRTITTGLGRGAMTRAQLYEFMLQEFLFVCLFVLL